MPEQLEVPQQASPLLGGLCLSQPLGSLVSSLRLRTWPIPAPVPRRLGCSLLGSRPRLFAVGGEWRVVTRSGLATWRCRAGCGCSIFLGRHWVVAATPPHCPLILACPAWRGRVKPHERQEVSPLRATGLPLGFFPRRRDEVAVQSHFLSPSCGFVRPWKTLAL